LEDWYFAHPDIIDDLLNSECAPRHIILRAFDTLPAATGFRSIFGCDVEVADLRAIYEEHGVLPAIEELDGIDDEVLEFLLATGRYDEVELRERARAYDE
jgi:hypothetical protein